MAEEVSVSDHSRRDEFFAHLTGAIVEFQKLMNNPADTRVLAAATENLSRYAKSGLISQGARAKFIESLRAIPEGDAAGQAALALYLGEMPSKNFGAQPQHYRYPTTRGRVGMVMFDAGIVKDSADQARRVLGDVSKSNTRALGELKAANDAILSSLMATVEDTRSQNARGAEHREQQLSTVLQDFNSDKDAIIKSCDEAHNRYTTAMEIQGPVEYWTAKFKDHKNACWWWGLVLIVYAVVAVAILCGVLYWTFGYVLSTTDQAFSHIALLVSASLAVSVTILFWAARFLSRLYLSERHMAIDAKLRSVMAKTYLALASNHQVKDEDRALVLAPLFRAGTDGIIKEETGFDSALAMLARALEKPAPR